MCFYDMHILFKIGSLLSFISRHNTGSFLEYRGRKTYLCLNDSFIINNQTKGLKKVRHKNWTENEWKK